MLDKYYKNDRPDFLDDADDKRRSYMLDFIIFILMIVSTIAYIIIKDV